MIMFAARSPPVNASSLLNQGLPVLGLKPNQNSLKPFGVQVATDMMVVPARILFPPRIEYNKKTATANFGAWNLVSNRFQVGANVGRWGVLVMGNPGGYAVGNEVDELMRIFEAELKSYGVRMEPYNVERKYWAKVNVFERAILETSLDDVFQRAKKHGVRLLVILLRDQDSYTYARLKYFGDVKYGIHTQAMVASKLTKEKGQLQYIGNVAMKVNLRMGGTNHFIKFENSQLRATDMLVGIDVTHPSPTSADNAPSIAAIVASKDKEFAQYPCSLRTQKSRQEMVDALEEMLVERLQFYRKTNNRLPERIIVYRDGVSEGQLPQVLEKEKPCLDAAFKRLYGEQKKWPKLMIVVVGKRHHTRFYPTRKDDADRSSNPKPGTVVDRHITMERGWDFYLQPHAGLQGTARPGHYTVIFDQWKLTADQLEQMVR